VVRGGELAELSDGRDREEAIARVLALVRAEPRTVVGLDFAFSLPAWYLDERGFATAAEAWAWAAHEARAGPAGWPRSLPPPFWGPGIRRRPPELAGAGARRALRRTEERSAVAGARPLSTFQLTGAGSVGAQALHGMALLGVLRAGGLAMWPFDAPRMPLAVEVFPRLLARDRTGDAASRLRGRAFREAVVDRLGPAVHAGRGALLRSNQDAFDAAVSALALARLRTSRLPEADEVDRREGRIWRGPLRTGAHEG
jgi:hypothetical protein